MRYEKLKKFNNEEFRRLTGVKRSSFVYMIEILNLAESKKKAAGGKPNHLVMEDRLLMALEYLREYRTYFHVSCSYGVSESSCYRNIKCIEDVLIKHTDDILDVFWRNTGTVPYEGQELKPGAGVYDLEEEKKKVLKYLGVKSKEEI